MESRVLINAVGRPCTKRELHHVRKRNARALTLTIQSSHKRSRLGKPSRVRAAIQHGGDEVFQDMNLARIFALKRPLLAVAAILTLLVPVHGQQEVDPTWYDPWKAAGNTIVRHTQPVSYTHLTLPTNREV